MEPAEIFLRCPRCRSLVQVEADGSGELPPCPKCGRVLPFPKEAAAPPQRRGRHEGKPFDYFGVISCALSIIGGMPGAGLLLYTALAMRPDKGRFFFMALPLWGVILLAGALSILSLTFPRSEWKSASVPLSLFSFAMLGCAAWLVYRQ
jgi:hypothetical protein